MDKRPSSAKARRECFEANKRVDENGRKYLVCHICGARFDPVNTDWEAEHVIPHAFGGDDLKPAHAKCHKRKTSEQDIPAIAKSKRTSDKHLGIKKKGWGGSVRRKLDGSVVPK